MIFTFDGDAAGQKAALRAFGGDQNFVAQTYVAVEPTGLDPCDLRIQQGDAAVRELVARRMPLYRFVLEQRRRQVRPRPGRRPGRRAARGRPAGLRDPRPVQGRGVRPRARRHGRRRRRAGPRRGAPRGEPVAGPSAARPPEDRGRAEPAEPCRAARRAAAARPARPAVRPRAGDPQAGRAAPAGRRRGWPRTSTAHDFTHPTYRAVWEAVTACGGPADAPGGEVWVGQAAGQRPATRRSSRPCRALAVEPLLSSKEPTTAYVAAHVFRLQELTAMRRIADLKSRLQRTNPVEHADRVQPDVRRAGRARAAPPHAARAGHRRRGVRDPFPRTAQVPADVVARAGLPPRRPGARAHEGRRRHLAARHPRRAGRAPRSTTPAGRLPWEQVETADWDRDEDRLRVAEVGEFGQPRPVARAHRLAGPGWLLQLIRERVTASVLLQRRARCRSGKRVCRWSPAGPRAAAARSAGPASRRRRGPRGSRSYAQAAEAALRDAQDELVRQRHGVAI